MKIETSGKPKGRYRGNVVPHLRAELEDRFIHAQTIVSKWEGEAMDRDLAVAMLVDLDDRGNSCRGAFPR